LKTTDDLKHKLSTFERTKLFNGISGWIGAGLYISGVFTNLSGNLTAIDTNSIVEEFERTSSKYSGELLLKNNRITSDESKPGAEDVVAGFITFDTTGVVNILESRGCSSVVDSGTTNYSVNFTEPLGNYIYTFITSEAVNVVSASMGSGSLNLIFDKPLSGVIKVLFFEKILTNG
jgi:hypothetical protein